MEIAAIFHISEQHRMVETTHRQMSRPRLTYASTTF